MKPMNDRWTVGVEDAEMQSHLFALQSKGECYLSPNTKLVGFEKAVLLTKKELVISFCNAVLPTLRRRHGPAVRLIILTCSTTDSRIDDLLVQARIEEGLFAPNRQPSAVKVADLLSKPKV